MALWALLKNGVLDRISSMTRDEFHLSIMLVIERNQHRHQQRSEHSDCTSARQGWITSLRSGWTRAAALSQASGSQIACGLPGVCKPARSR